MIPDIFVKDKVFQNKPGAVEYNEERQAGQTGFSLIHATSKHKSCGQVDEAGNHCPGGVDGQAVEDELVEHSPPEQRTTSLELVLMFKQVPGHEGNDCDVGDGDGEEDDGG